MQKACPSQPFYTHRKLFQKFAPLLVCYFLVIPLCQFSLPFAPSLSTSRPHRGSGVGLRSSENEQDCRRRRERRGRYSDEGSIALQRQRSPLTCSERQAVCRALEGLPCVRNAFLSGQVVASGAKPEDLHGLVQSLWVFRRVDGSFERYASTAISLLGDDEDADVTVRASDGVGYTVLAVRGQCGGQPGGAHRGELREDEERVVQGPHLEVLAVDLNRRVAALRPAMKVHQRHANPGHLGEVVERPERSAHGVADSGLAAAGHAVDLS
eukprot:scaffold2952_cov312-Pinguiococcus_pyrenoidosus.AAC.17